MVVPETVSVGYNYRVRTARRRGKVSKKVGVRILQGFNILGGVRIHEHSCPGTVGDLGVAFRGAEWKRASLDVFI